MLITVVVPTIRGREEHYERCVAAYHTRSEHSLHIVTVRDRPTCGEAWNEGAEQATGDFLHFTADDLEPERGWDTAAVAAVESGFLPAPRIVNQHGRLDSCGLHGVEMPDGAKVPMSVIPFMPMSLWAEVGPVLPVHYYSDNFVSWRAARAGWVTRVCRGFAFTHYWAEPGRGAGMGYGERMAHDGELFAAAVRAAL